MSADRQADKDIEEHRSLWLRDQPVRLSSAGSVSDSPAGSSMAPSASLRHYIPVRFHTAPSLPSGAAPWVATQRVDQSYCTRRKEAGVWRRQPSTETILIRCQTEEKNRLNQRAEHSVVDVLKWTSPFQGTILVFFKVIQNKVFSQMCAFTMHVSLITEVIFLFVRKAKGSSAARQLRPWRGQAK